MLEDRALFDQVRRIIEHETEQVVELNSVLREETKTLQSLDAAGLAKVLDKKVSPLAALNESRLGRYAILRSIAYPESEEAWASLISELDAASDNTT